MRFHSNRFLVNKIQIDKIWDFIPTDFHSLVLKIAQVCICKVLKILTQVDVHCAVYSF